MFAQNTTAVAVRESVSDAYNDAMDELHDQTVWSHRGFSTYYRNSKDRVVYIMPFTNVEFWQRVQESDLTDFEQYDVAYVPAASPATVN